jgi:TPR repeat protein
MYGAGNGVPQDIVQAHKWYNLSTANSHGTYGKPVSPKNITGKN